MSVIIPPFLGEFGVMVMEHLRYVHSLAEPEKIVCCEKGQECLFPSASEFFTDFVNPVEDANRIHRGPSKLKREYLVAVDEIYRRVVARYPGISIIAPQYPPRQRLCSTVKFRPVVPSALPHVDVVICPRHRAVSPEKNWSHWSATVEQLKQSKFTIGVAGSEATCCRLPADAYAWQHPGGATEGCVDLLTHCRLFLGSDTGVSHLAALMDTPQIVFGFWNANNPNCTNLMQISNRRFCRVLLDGWNDPRRVVDEALSYLC